MAHNNIELRRNEVLAMNGIFDRKKLRSIAIKYNCTYSCTYQDFIILNKDTPITLYISAKVRKHILQRDNRTCQYCSITTGKIIIEHVIPYILYGHAKDYNLVASCQKCNLIKRSSVWIPDNFNVLSSINPEWAEKIIKLSVPKKI